MIDQHQVEVEAAEGGEFHAAVARGVGRFGKIVNPHIGRRAFAQGRFHEPETGMQHRAAQEKDVEMTVIRSQCQMPQLRQRRVVGFQQARTEKRDVARDRPGQPGADLGQRKKQEQCHREEEGASPSAAPWSGRICHA